MPSDSRPSESRPPDAILLEAPRFLVGPDEAGCWLAMEAHGFGGGIFATQDAALRFARGETRRRPGAVDLVERLSAFP